MRYTLQGHQIVSVNKCVPITLNAGITISCANLSVFKTETLAC